MCPLLCKQGFIASSGKLSEPGRRVCAEPRSAQRYFNGIRPAARLTGLYSYSSVKAGLSGREPRRRGDLRSVIVVEAFQKNRAPLHMDLAMPSSRVFDAW